MSSPEQRASMDYVAGLALTPDGVVCDPASIDRLWLLVDRNTGLAQVQFTAYFLSQRDPAADFNAYTEAQSQLPKASRFGGGEPDGVLYRRGRAERITPYAAIVAGVELWQADFEQHYLHVPTYSAEMLTDDAVEPPDPAIRKFDPAALEELAAVNPETYGPAESIGQYVALLEQQDEALNDAPTDGMVDAAAYADLPPVEPNAGIRDALQLSDWLLRHIVLRQQMQSGDFF